MCDSVKLNLGGIVFLEIEGIKRTQRRIIMLTLPNPVLWVGALTDWAARPDPEFLVVQVWSHDAAEGRKAVWMAGTGRAGGAWSCYFREVGWGRSSETL